MTTAEAVVVLRTIPAGVGTARERAIEHAISQLLTPSTAPKAKPRKVAAKPRVHPSVAAFLKIKFPSGTTGMTYAESASLREADERLSPEARVQLTYGRRGAGGSDKARDAAMLYAAAA